MVGGRQNHVQDIVIELELQASETDLHELRAVDRNRLPAAPDIDVTPFPVLLVTCPPRNPSL